MLARARHLSCCKFECGRLVNFNEKITVNLHIFMSQQLDLLKRFNVSCDGGLRSHEQNAAATAEIIEYFLVYIAVSKIVRNDKVSSCCDG